jgi:hypothetical protein
VVKNSDPSEESSPSTFWVTNLVQVDVQVLRWKKIMAVLSLLQHPPKTTVTLKIKAVGYIETSEYFITIRCRNPKDDH